MDVSVPAVESLLFRARKNLAAILRPLKTKRRNMSASFIPAPGLKG